MTPAPNPSAERAALSEGLRRRMAAERITALLAEEMVRSLAVARLVLEEDTRLAGPIRVLVPPCANYGVGER